MEEPKGIPIIENRGQDLQIFTSSPTLSKYTLIERKQQWDIVKLERHKPSLINIVRGIFWGRVK
jgi:hypothetical protein